MSSSRFEILLPTRYNDGTAVEEDRIAQTRRDLIAEFGAITWCPERLQGLWSHQGRVFEDSNIKVTIDVEDTPAVQRFFQNYKNTLKERFRQIDIWIVSYEVRELSKGSVPENPRSVER